MPHGREDGRRVAGESGDELHCADEAIRDDDADAARRPSGGRDPRLHNRRRPSPSGARLRQAR
jgi:hypothetical protein